jgi:HK97 family phage major capsid protein
MNPMASFAKEEKREEIKDKADTVEYREAFMNYVCRNTPIPMELRATTTEDASAVIPTTLLHEIVRKMDAYGNVWAKVRKLNVQGGVDIPVLSLTPVANWVDEATPSEAQKVQANTKVSFHYYGIECKIAQTLLVNVTTLEMFQSLFVELATEAIVKAIEVAIIKGTGSGQPTGITVDSRVPSANKITLSAEEFGSWEGWKKKVFAKMKKAYRNGIFLMAQGTFDGYIDGMVDQNGQPIARVNYGIADGEVYRFGGKTVETVEDDIIADYETASSGDVVAVFVDLSKYGVNSNMTMNVVKWTDHDTNQVKNKAQMIVDGKLIDPNGVLIIKKA